MSGDDLAEEYDDDSLTDQSASQVYFRGDLRIKSRMEMLQDGYLHAVAAAAGCTVAKPYPDNGIDWQLTHESTRHSADDMAELKVQLKATTQSAPNPCSGHVSVKLRRKRFEMLARKKPTVNRILIAMILPSDVGFWLKATHDLLELRHCAYWVNMAGWSIPGDSASVSVSVPTNQIFDDQSLCDIMCRIGRGGVP